MSRGNYPLFAFNRGIVSPLALARTDVKRLALSAVTQTNWMPRVLGSMMLRPGFQYLGSTLSSNACNHVSFEKAADDKAIIELTDGYMRVRVDDVILTRPSVTTSIANSSFATDLTSWTDNDDSGGVSVWATGGYLSLTGDGTNYAIRDQTVTTVETGTLHAVRVIVYQGNCQIRIGSTSGGDEYITETILLPGIHSLAFTPTGNFYIRLMSSNNYTSLISSCAIEAVGDLTIPTPWTDDDLNSIRTDQSGDVVFVCCGNSIKQKRIERRNTNSWSVADYVCDDGPFRNENLSPITMAVSAISGVVTITASKPVFKSGHVGALFSISSIGQTVNKSITTENLFTDPIKITGVGDGRIFSIEITGTFVGTLTLQRSLLAPGDWNTKGTYTTAQTVSFNDETDNQVAYYRIGIKTGDYTSGTADATLTFSNGSITGIARVTAYTSATLVTASVLRDFGGTVASDIWAEGLWSEYRGYPSSLAFFDGRLWFMGKDKICGSVSDGFDSFDIATIGDSGPIIRSLGSGPVDTINFVIPLKRLVLGTPSREPAIRSNDFNDPLTPDNFNIKDISTIGSTNVEADRIDDIGVFVGRNTSRVYQVDFSVQSNDYVSNELTTLAPEVCRPGIVRMAVQRNPDTRLHLVRSDGVVVVLVFDKNEDVTCFMTVETDGLVEDVLVQPGSEEDNVYYQIKRTVNGSTVRYLEKWALETECVGGTLNKQADSFVVYSGAATTSIPVAHLEGATVVCWADGVDQGEFVVTSGVITLPVAVENAITGLSYTADYESTKLAYGAQAGTALAQKKRLDHVGLILANTHASGLKYGSDFDNLDDLPLIEQGYLVDGDTVHEAFDADSIEFNGTWSTDSRLCLRAQAPKPCTVLAAVISLDLNEKL